MSGTQFVAGDDFGKLKLYNYPVIKPKVTLDQLNASKCQLKELFSRGKIWFKKGARIEKLAISKNIHISKFHLERKKSVDFL